MSETEEPQIGVNAENEFIAKMIGEFTRSLKNNHTGHKTTESSTYDGTRDAMIIDSWIFTLENYRDFHSWAGVRTKNYAVTLLRGHAGVWYRTLQVTNDVPANWDSMKEALKKYFRPENSVILARDKLAEFRQTGSLVK